MRILSSVKTEQVGGWYVFGCLLGGSRSIPRYTAAGKDIFGHFVGTCNATVNIQSAGICRHSTSRKTTQTPSYPRVRTSINAFNFIKTADYSSDSSSAESPKKAALRYEHHIGRSDENGEDVSKVFGRNDCVSVCAHSVFDWSEASSWSFKLSSGSFQVIPGLWTGIGGFHQVRYKKARRKKEVIQLNDEQKNTKATLPPIRLEDRIATPPPAYAIAKNIRASISRIVSGGVSRKQHSIRNRFQLSEARAHQNSKNSSVSSVFPALSMRLERQKNRKLLPREFVTPLTKLQHEANLPLSVSHARFDFPHTLHYQCWWGPPSTEDEEPNFSKCRVSIKLDELGLTERQVKRLVDVVGQERFDKQTGIVCLEADIFPDRNHNAAYLGDILEMLMREAKKG